MPRAKFVGYDEAHKSENITVANLYLNDEILTSLEGENWKVGDFTENIRFEYDPYAQMAKNTVDSKGQLGESSCVRFDNIGGKGIRVMFVGNSITLHGIAPAIGWYGEYGMAASSKNNDYVHLLEAGIKKIDPEAAFCICQVAEWERGYKNGSDTYHAYEEARKFGADVIILRFVENVKKDEYDSEIFVREYDKLVKYLDRKGNAKLVATTGFWRHPADSDIIAYAKEKGLPCVELGDLGEDAKMKAIGLFEHRGVANHPGDEGMKAIADRIMETLVKEKYIRRFGE